MAAAVRGQSQGPVAGNVVAAEVLDRTFCVHDQVRRRAREIGREADAASPSFVLSQSQLGDLAKLRAIPLQSELHWGFVQIGRASPGTVNLEHAGVAEIEIGSHRLRFQPDAPGIFGFLPRAKVASVSE